MAQGGSCTLGFLGGGMMAEALINGLISKEVCEPESVWVSDPLPKRLNFLDDEYGVHTTTDNAQAACLLTAAF